LHPEASAKSIRRYSQQYVDLINMEQNRLETLPVETVLDTRDPISRYIAQQDQGGYLVPLRSLLIDQENAHLVLTFAGLFQRTPLAERMTKMLQILEKHYHSPVDTEFTVEVTDPLSLQPDVRITLLQCRPQSHLQENEARLPQNLKDKDIIFSTHRMAPEGRVSGIRHVVFVSPEAYYALPEASDRGKLGRAIGRLNAALADTTFICIGPGRWGTSNPDLGVRIGYADIYNARALVEVTGPGIGPAPEASFGTHFFQDLVESNIYPLAIYMEDEDVIFNRDFFYRTPNRLLQILPDAVELAECLRLIEVNSYRRFHHIQLVMDDEQGRAVAFLVPD
jgi:hypothetical protein